MLPHNIKQYFLRNVLKPQQIIDTTRSTVLLYEEYVVKISLLTESNTAILKERGKKILSFQGVLLYEKEVFIDANRYLVRKLKRFSEDHSIANIILAPTAFTELDMIINRHIEISKILPPSDVGYKIFWGDLCKNYTHQIGWIYNNFDKNCHYVINRSFYQLLERAHGFFNFTNHPCTVLTHGDLHAGNMYTKDSQVYFLDPTETEEQFCRVPVWADLASFGSSALLLGKDHITDNLICRLSDNYPNFNNDFFRLWMLIKSLVRIKYETILLNTNRHLGTKELTWRNEVCEHGLVRLNDYYSKNLQVKTTNNLSSPDETFYTTTSQIIKTLESRRTEISQKANVFLVACAALLGGSLSFVTSTTKMPPYASFLLYTSFCVTVLSSFGFIGMIKRLPKGNPKVKDRSRLFFFGWIAKQDKDVLHQSLLTISKEQYLNEVVLQVKSLSTNLQYRYDLIKRSSHLFFIGAGLFTLSVLSMSAQVQGVVSFVLRILYSFFANHSTLPGGICV